MATGTSARRQRAGGRAGNADRRGGAVIDQMPWRIPVNTDKPTEPLPEEPSSGLGRHLESLGLEEEVTAMIYPDRRGSGYGLSRFRDSPWFDFTRIEKEPDVHFAHKRGFVAKSSATEVPRLKELLAVARAAE